MKKQYRRVIHNYFSDYITWLLIVSFLFIISFVAAIAFNGVNGFVWLIPILFLIIYSLSMPLLILYCKALQDIKKENIEKVSLEVFKIQYDDRFSFKNSGGASVGKTKYRIIDENHNIYLLSATTNKEGYMIFQSDPNFYLRIEFLEKSRLVLSMKIVEPSKTIKDASKQHNIKHLKKVFNCYF